MSIYQNIYNTFVEILGEPSSEENLNDYITFVFENATSKNLNKNYCEDHHIIPACVYQNNLIYTLEYTDHVKAHVLLAKAYPISKFIRPLNFMLNREEKEAIDFRKMHSDAIKTWWKLFRKTDEYNIWLEKIKRFGKSDQNIKHVLEVMTPAAAEARKDPIKEKARIDAIKAWWTEEKRKQKSENLIAYNKENGTQRYTDALNKRWSTMSSEGYEEFCKTMTEVNRRPEKRKIAGKKIKDKWNNDEKYKEKMKNRRPRGSDGSNISKRWKEPGFKEAQILARRLAKIKKKATEEELIFMQKLSNDEIIKRFEHYYRKVNNKTPNKDLKYRLEVDIIKLYKRKNKIKHDPMTNRGWYRKSTDDLKTIIKTYYSMYGMVKEYENQIKEIINETN
jgi:hypothetical protein